ncbi:alpha/beta hydrolase family protein [Paenibacillus sedimenti]|uniref:Alpha/beta fold hydrolase n=1 Tax=Paenibacillus sedimenti TaxID=2770274 RepID=A0A926KVS8_9BACL|nr:alpha/beta fold hydrolase [Paenibacillus sedimenti]MBD0382865.1 alpha/beta fold hydrolase [Paenibacillus sedimenti]
MRTTTEVGGFTFPIGYHQLHKVKIIDYQLNRWYSFGYTQLHEMREAARLIKTLDDWKPVMLQMASRALQEERYVEAAFAFRAAEFFALPSDPDKKRIYGRFLEIFYDKAYPNHVFERGRVPYEGGYLPTLYVPSRTNQRLGTVVIHGGFDSFVEELYSWADTLARRGYDVVLFEGPGQGGALKNYGLPLTHEWEKPVKAVLDHYQLDNVTLLGVSMGGWLCFRAAAFETRIKRVIASSVAFDYLQIPPAPVAWFAKVLLKLPNTMNKLAYLKARARMQERWGIYNLMYITKKDTPIEASKVMLQLNEENLHSNKVTQDVLILTGAKDHFIPLKIHHKQIAALIHAKSVTGRIIRKEEQGHNHCQVGNMGLALKLMADWLDARLRD